MLKYASGPRPILIALSVALATLALQMSEWNSVLQDMATSFSTSPTTWNALLQFISVLPEEINESRKMSLTEEQLQRRIELLLTGNADQVLSLLTAYTQSITNATDANPLLFACLTSWLREIPITKMMQSPLVELTFQALSIESLFDNSVDLICAIFRETNEVNDPEMIKIIEQLYPKLMLLRPRIQQSREDPDTFRGYARLFAEAGEAWVILIARSPQQFLPLVEAIAEAASIDDDLEIVKFTFIFWYDLKQAITSPRYEEARRIFAPVYLGLVDVMIHHLHYPKGPDVDDSDLFQGDHDAEDKFRDFRHEMGDVLKDCCNVVGGSTCLAKAFQQVQTLMGKSKTEQVAWQEIEAPLFSMRAMAREISLDEEDVLPHIMDTLLSLPEHPKIRYAATLVLGRYTEWTARHPNYLLSQLNYITSGFTGANSDVDSAAAQALKHFCRDCSTLLVDHIEQLYGFYAQVLPALDFESRVETTEGIAHVVSAQPREKLYLALKSFVSPILERIAQTCKTFDSDEKTHRNLADDIELLTVFAFTVAPYIEPAEEHPCVKVYEEVWPVLSASIDTYGSLQFICERVCSWMKTVLNRCRRHTISLLPAFAEKLAVSFDKYRYGCFLWVSGACVREFASAEDNDAATVNAVWSFVESQSVGMFKLLGSTEPRLISNVVEDFFRLMTDALLGNPDTFLQSRYLDTTMQACLASLSIEQVDALTTILRFLRDLIAWSHSSPPTSGQQISPQARSNLEALISKYGSQLVQIVFLGQLHTFPNDCITDASGVLLGILEAQPAIAITWIEASFAGLPSGSITDPEKAKFMTNMTQSCSIGEFRKARSYLQDLTTLCRRKTVGRFEGLHSTKFNYA